MKQMALYLMAFLAGIIENVTCDIQ